MEYTHLFHCQIDKVQFEIRHAGKKRRRPVTGGSSIYTHRFMNAIKKNDSNFMENIILLVELLIYSGIYIIRYYF